MTWLIAFVVMLLVVAGMAIGVMAGRKPIAGSCGGIANLGIDKVCGICGNDFTKCENQNPAGTGDDAGTLNSTDISRPV
ncbi:MAG: (Na+)-NQR maturation NqrM [Lautropia sp.]|nr:(Na+)-NQR maturation NqrM [Lautropia sp.]